MNDFVWVAFTDDVRPGWSIPNISAESGQNGTIIVRQVDTVLQLANQWAYVGHSGLMISVRSGSATPLTIAKVA